MVRTRPMPLASRATSSTVSLGLSLGLAHHSHGLVAADLVRPDLEVVQSLGHGVGQGLFPLGPGHVVGDLPGGDGHEGPLVHQVHPNLALLGGMDHGHGPAGRRHKGKKTGRVLDPFLGPDRIGPGQQQRGQNHNPPFTENGMFCHGHIKAKPVSHVNGLPWLKGSAIMFRFHNFPFNLPPRGLERG